MNASIIHLLILGLLFGFGTKAGSASATNTLSPGIVIIVKREPDASSQAATGQTSVVNSNSAAGNDLGVGASSPVPQQIRLLEDGAVGDYGLVKVFFPAEITESAITIITPDGRKLACRAAFLAVHDTASGQTLRLGEVTNSIGVLIEDNAVVYKNAFGNQASVRYRYTKHSLGQDIILHQAIKLPETFQPENLRLEVWTEWVDSTPDAKESQMIDLRPLAATATEAAVPAIDEQAKFGATRIGDGYAFGIENEGEKTPVAKTFARIEARDWLIERVDYTALKPMLDTLPMRQAGLSPDDLKSDRVQLVRSLPARTNSKPSGTPMLVAKAAPADEHGIVLDFVIVSSVPVPAGVVSWWPAGGNANDAISASGNHGAWLGAATYGGGKVGQGFALDGVDDGVTVPNVSTLGFYNVTDTFTIEAWIKPQTNNTDFGVMSIIGKRYSPNFYTASGWELDVVNGALAFQISDLYIGPASFVVSGDLRDGAFHHVAATVDRSVTNGVKLYVDGVAYSFDPTGHQGDMSNQEPVRIGVHPDSGLDCFFKGTIDEPAIYGRALGASEIQGIYNAGVAGKNNPNCVVAPTNIVAWWPGDGNPYDLARTNFATLSGATYESAVASQGFSFNGTNAGVTAANDNALNLATTNDNLTIEAWVKPLANTNDYGVMSVVGKRYSPNIYSATGYELYLANTAINKVVVRWSAEKESP